MLGAGGNRTKIDGNKLAPVVKGTTKKTKNKDIYRKHLLIRIARQREALRDISLLLIENPKCLVFVDSATHQYGTGKSNPNVLSGKKFPNTDPNKPMSF